MTDPPAGPPAAAQGPPAPSGGSMPALPAGPPSAAQVLAAAPPVRVEPGARHRIRASHARTGRRIAVLDDDPTGSQTVHDVSIVTVFDDAEYAAGLDAA